MLRGVFKVCKQRKRSSLETGERRAICFFSNQGFTHFVVKGIVVMNYISNMYDFLSSEEHKRGYFGKCRLQKAVDPH